jgi:hypothetical protein
MANDDVVREATKLGRKHAKQLAAPIVEAIKKSNDKSYQEGYVAGRSDASMSEPPCPECRMDTRFHAADCKYHRTAYERGYTAGRAEALEEAAKIAGRYWHLSGTDCDDRDNCGIVGHYYRRPEYIAKLIRALANTPRY